MNKNKYCLYASPDGTFEKLYMFTGTKPTSALCSGKCFIPRISGITENLLFLPVNLNKMRKKERFDKVINYFLEAMPVAETELHHKNPYELLVSVILSAQCTDKRVNQITPALFKAYPTAEALSKATIDDIYQYIKSCSYPNNKAKHLSGMSRMLVGEFNNEVPPDTKALQKLPGVGRKTANVIASVIYNQPALAVDTHVFRVAARLGLTSNAKTPLETEKQLVRYIPGELIPRAHHWLILHGRYVCLARNPQCHKCGLKDFCRYYEQNVV